jgi:hypothetical protein
MARSLHVRVVGELCGTRVVGLVDKRRAKFYVDN